MSLVFTPEGTPASPVEGEVYYDSTADKLKVRDASGFREVVSKNSSGEIDGTFSGTILSPTGLNLLDSRVDTSDINYAQNVTVLDWSSYLSTYNQFKINCTVKSKVSGTMNLFFSMLEGSTRLYYEGRLSGSNPVDTIATPWSSISGVDEFVLFAYDFVANGIASLSIDFCTNFAGTGSNNHDLLIRSGYNRHGKGGQEQNGSAINVNRSGTTNIPEKLSLNFDPGVTSGSSTQIARVYAQVYGVGS